MIAIDTNILVRYILQDDDIQSPLASELIDVQCSEKNPAVINMIVLCELIWVLRFTYKYEREHLVPLLKQILSTDCFNVQNSSLVWKATYDFENGNADFSDYLIAHINRSDMGAKLTVTFDKKAGKHKFYKLLN